MVRHLDSELQDLKDHLLEMGGRVEKAIEEACEAALGRKPEKLDHVLSLEKRINELHLTVDQACLVLLAQQAPVARDLRLVLAIIKMNTDLERMGDQAVNISLTVRDYLKFEALPEFTKDLSSMVEEVQSMVKDCLDAFVRRDVDLSQNVLQRDDIVDQFKAKMVSRLRQKMGEDPESIDGCLCLINIARNLERLADHATNIAEDVIFFTTGDDIRHGHRSEGTGL